MRKTTKGEVVRWCVRCDGLNIIFDLFFHAFASNTHSTLPRSFGRSVGWLVHCGISYFARVFCSLNTISTKFHEFFFPLLFIPFGVWTLSSFFPPSIRKSPVTKHWPLFFSQKLYACKGSPSSSYMFAFHVILPYGHAEPLITFLLRAHFLLISSLNTPAMRINELKQLKKGQILMLYACMVFFTFLTTSHASLFHLKHFFSSYERIWRNWGRP